MHARRGGGGGGECCTPAALAGRCARDFIYYFRTAGGGRREGGRRRALAILHACTRDLPARARRRAGGGSPASDELKIAAPARQGSPLFLCCLVPCPQSRNFVAPLRASSCLVGAESSPAACRSGFCAAFAEARSPAERRVGVLSECTVLRDLGFQEYREIRPRIYFRTLAIARPAARETAPHAHGPIMADHRGCRARFGPRGLALGRRMPNPGTAVSSRSPTQRHSEKSASDCSRHSTGGISTVAASACLLLVCCGAASAADSRTINGTRGLPSIAAANLCAKHSPALAHAAGLWNSST